MDEECQEIRIKEGKRNEENYVSQKREAIIIPIHRFYNRSFFNFIYFFTICFSE